METTLIIKCIAHERTLLEGCQECLSPDAWDLFEQPAIDEDDESN